MMPTLMSQIEVESQSNRNFDSYRRSRIKVESKSNRNCNSRLTQLRLLGFCFSGTSLLGKQGQICFAKYLKIVKSFSLKLFVRTGRTSDFVLKHTKGGFR